MFMVLLMMFVVESINVVKLYFIRYTYFRERVDVS